MSVFDSTFNKPIVNELTKRKSIKGGQDVFTPFARATSMVRGDIEGIRIINGFTLGIPDNSSPLMQNSFTTLYNPEKSEGSTVGITYTSSGKSKLVTIPTSVKNIPSPGMVSLVVNNLYHGGFTFTAEMEFKWYTIDQYNFLYQVFFRPGLDIVIDWGQVSNKTERPETLIFDDHTVGELANYSLGYPSRRNGPLEDIRSPNYDFMVGTVTNFKITYESTDEYRGVVEIKGISELAFTLPSKNTMIDSRGPEAKYTSNSLATLFGQVQRAKLDDNSVLFEKMKEDLEDPEKRKYIIKVTSADKIQNAERGFKSTLINLGRAIARPLVTGGFFGDTVYYISLHYFFEEMLPFMINNIGLCDKNKSGNNKIGPYRDKLAHLLIKKEYLNLIDIGQYRYLRTVRPDLCFIHNYNCYTDLFSSTMSEKYENRFVDANKLWAVNPNWALRLPDATDPKHWYVDTAPEDRGLRGIYVNFAAIRDAFVNNETFADAIINILDYVNTSSNGLLSLKYRYIEEMDIRYSGAGQLIKFKLEDSYFIFNEKEIARELTIDPYMFNERTPDLENPKGSELLDISFDFALPQQAAASLLFNKNLHADTLTENTSTDTDELLVFGSGYDPSIENIFPQYDGNVNNRDDILKSNCEESKKVASATETKTEEDEDKEKTEKAIDDDNRDSSTWGSISGYIEFLPEEMYKSSLTDGSSKLMHTLPSNAKVSLKLLGISGFRYGELFRVDRILPSVYNDGVFFLEGFKHELSPEGWITNIEGQFIGKPIRTRQRASTSSTIAKTVEELVEQEQFTFNALSQFGIGGPPLPRILPYNTVPGIPEEWNSDELVEKGVSDAYLIRTITFLRNANCNGVKMPEHVIAGFIGNLAEESQLKPTAVNQRSKAFGIAQWLGGRKDNLISMYPDDYRKLDSQLQFMCWELSNPGYRGGESHQYAKILKANNVDEATRLIMEYYERPSPEEKRKSINRRLNFARNAYYRMQNGDMSHFSINQLITYNRIFKLLLAPYLP